MKTMKKLASLLLALAMIFSLATTAFAGTITVTGQEGETYTAYKIFDVSYADTDTTKDGYEAYSYTINSSSDWYSVVSGYKPAEGTKGFTINQSSTTNVYNVVPVEGFSAADAAAFAKYLNTNKPQGAIGVSGKIVANDDDDTTGSVSLTVTDPGYYFVTTSLGSLCILNTADDSVNVEEKNEVPTQEKKVQEEKDSKWVDSSDAEIGETVNYQVTIQAKKGTTNYVLHDKMTDGLTFDNTSVVVTKDGQSVNSTNNWELVTTGLTDGCDFEIKLNFLNGADADSTVVVTYSATINANAAIAGEGNKNESFLEYGDAGETTHDIVTTYVWEFTVFKYTGTNIPLAGAKFSLYTDVDCTQAVKLKKSENIYKVDATITGNGDEIETDSTGKFEIEGLDSGTYYLKEIEAPDGYNKLTAPITVIIDNNGNVKQTADGEALADKTVKIENKTGTELPSTGGMGTTLFYVLGGILFTAAVVLLVTKKRMAN